MRRSSKSVQAGWVITGQPPIPFDGRRSPESDGKHHQHPGGHDTKGGTLTINNPALRNFPRSVATASLTRWARRVEGVGKPRILLRHNVSRGLHPSRSAREMGLQREGDGGAGGQLSQQRWLDRDGVHGLVHRAQDDAAVTWARRRCRQAAQWAFGGVVIERRSCRGGPSVSSVGGVPPGRGPVAHGFAPTKVGWRCWSCRGE